MLTAEGQWGASGVAGMFTVFIGVIVVQAYTLVKTHPAGQPQSVHFLVSSPSFKVLRRGGLHT